MKTQEILDNIQIGVSPITGRIYIGLQESYKDGVGVWKIKSDFTDRLQKFLPESMTAIEKRYGKAEPYLYIKDDSE